MKIRHFISLILGTGLSFSLAIISPVVSAEEQEKTSYHLIYSNDSPLKSIPLNKAEFKASLYSNGVPKGHHEFQTNEEGEFELEDSMKAHPAFIGMSLIQLNDAAKNNQSCEGHLLQGKNELVVSCQAR